MIVLKTTTLAFGLFGLLSMATSESVMPDMMSCKAYLLTQAGPYNSSRFTSELKQNGTFLVVNYDGGLDSSMFTRECIEVKVE